MTVETIVENGRKIAVITADEPLLTDAESALDLIMAARYEAQADRVILYKETVAEKFFILSSGLAGEILQKFINYQAKLAIIGDYSRYTSKPLKDFIRESNKGKDVFFVETLETAVRKLGK